MAKDYGFGKTYRLKDAYTALNGCVQYYSIKFPVNLIVEEPEESDPDFENKIEQYKKAQANFLRILETLRTFGGQPIITEIKWDESLGKTELKFTLEQANVYGRGINDNGEAQVSAKWDDDELNPGSKKVNSFIDGAKEKIVDLFLHVTDVDGQSLSVADSDINIEKVMF